MRRFFTLNVSFNNLIPTRFLPTHVVIKLMKRIDKKIRKDQNEENDFMIANSNNCAQMGFESYEVDDFE
ncbi:hypothetical protein RO3G_09639 [Rhizopus delemar RA 99-880]|uniref:Uncharacterized protein n=1 Tax=Rhizopus delemar (strain RA 99-880 / ATCC MYA-4621 / FGSC 9543 / NRRL 43880) TaxID=246409 RepID=I1C8Z9_RHIO9|nr:hypothetical protein RO3G_09639 [Rhizopus delemar RA 99-880]|eukprot:EIE84929.1 hypothetical protein RO3G_09639 [Rhizopus delemar RA 99-880]